GLLGPVGGLALGEGGGLALAGAGRLVELTAEALVLRLQGTEASLKGLAAGTRDSLHTSIIGEALAAAALPRPWSRDQLELDALNKSSPTPVSTRTTRDAAPPPLQDVTPHVRVFFGKATFDPASHRLRQKLLLVNVGPEGIWGPLRLVLDGLPRRV